MLLWLAVLSLLLVSAAMMVLIIGTRSIRFLRDCPLALPANPPKVSVIVAARDEERNLAAALDALLDQDYPDYEVIVVNDRSTDGTSAILARKAAQHVRLRTLSVVTLPAGWLGKNHALHIGAAEAAGAMLIFADADIMMRRDTVSRAVSHALKAGRDHVAVAPVVTAPGVLLRMFMPTFTMFFSLYARPWNAPDPRSRRFIGIGAFNMVRADVYRAIGGHRRIAMRPDDDLKLGKIIKAAGYSQEMLFGRDSVSVEWYPSLGALARGFEKNALAGVNYSVAAILLATAAQTLFFIWPFIALAVAGGAAFLFYVAICLLLLAVDAEIAHAIGMPRWYAIGLPLTVVLFVWILWRATFITLRDGGVTWRGTHYSLAALKANRI